MKSIYVFRCLAMAAICTTLLYEETLQANPACDNFCVSQFYDCQSQANRNYNACVNALNPQTTAGIQACATTRSIHLLSCISTLQLCFTLCDQQERALEDAREIVREAIECGREGD